MWTWANIRIWIVLCIIPNSETLLCLVQSFWIRDPGCIHLCLSRFQHRISKAFLFILLQQSDLECTSAKINLRNLLALGWSHLKDWDLGQQLCFGVRHLVQWASLVAQMVKNLPAIRETSVRFLDWEDPLEKEMATHSSILAWRIPWTEEPGGLQSIGSQRVGHNWSDLVLFHSCEYLPEYVKIACSRLCNFMVC